MISLDKAAGENRYQLEPVDKQSLDKNFDHRWAMIVLEQAAARFHQSYRAEVKLDLYNQLRQLRQRRPP